MKKKRFFWTLLVVFSVMTALVPLFSQDTGGAVIIFASGNGFEHIQEGETREYDLAVDVAEGLELEAGDYLNSYEGTFLEIQILPSNNIVKVAENTSFRIAEMDTDGGGKFELSYGRVRARVEKISGLGRFTIDGPSIVAGVRGTDFGYDIIYQAQEGAERTVATVYCFDGNVEVEQKDSETAETGEKVVISADEMVRLVEREPETEDTGVEYLLVKEEVSEYIEEYWQVNDFQGKVLIPDKETLKEEAPLEVISADDLAREKRRRQLRQGAAVSGGLGILFGTAALTFVYADSLFEGVDQSTRDSSAIAFGAVAGVSLSTSLRAFLLSFR